MKKLILIIILFTFLVGIFSGCTNKSDNDDNSITDAEAQQKIIGLWKRNNYDSYQTWDFKTDNTIIVYGSSITFDYWFQNNSLYMYQSQLEIADIYKYEFSNNFNDLTITLLNPLYIDPETGEPVEGIEFKISFSKIV